MENIAVQLLVIVGGIFAGFFTLARMFIKYNETKDKAFSNLTERFIEISKGAYDVLQKNHDALTELTAQVREMNMNDGAVLSALRENSEALSRAIRIIEVHEKDTTKQLKIINQQ